MPVFTPDQLRKAAADVFVAYDIPVDEAELVAGFLVKSNLMGHDSHGVIRIPQYLRDIKNGNIVPAAKVEVVSESPSHAVLNGNWGFGYSLAVAAMEVAIDKAGECGISAVGMHNCNHIGRLGGYPAMAAERGMVAVLTVNAHGAAPSTVPWGGTERRLPTNPICYGLPCGGEWPLLLDMTTSVMAEGKVRVKKNRGEPTPEGWLIDSEGNPTTDPNKYYDVPRGAFLPLGGIAGHKGFGLGMVVDILSGVLTGAGTTRENITRIGNGVFITVIDIKRFLPLEDFKRQVDEFISYVKSSPTMPGVEEILVPGEVEAKEEAKRSVEGIFVEDETWGQITDLGKEKGLTL